MHRVPATRFSRCHGETNQLLDVFDDLGGRASAVSTPIGVRKLKRRRSQSLTSR
jgi:hypothetical protein